jgi:hypothetical protein
MAKKKASKKEVKVARKVIKKSINAALTDKLVEKAIKRGSGKTEISVEFMAIESPKKGKGKWFKRSGRKPFVEFSAKAKAAFRAGYTKVKRERRAIGSEPGRQGREPGPGPGH